MASSYSSYKDVQGHVQDFFDRRKVNFGNIEKSRQYCLNESIDHSFFIKWDKQKPILNFVTKWHFHLLYNDTFKTFSIEVSDVKTPWNAKSRRYFHFKLQQGDEKTRIISFCRGKLDKIAKTDEQTSGSRNQCRYANGEEYRMNKLPRVSTAKNI